MCNRVKGKTSEIILDDSKSHQKSEIGDSRLNTALEQELLGVVFGQEPSTKNVVSDFPTETEFNRFWFEENEKDHDNYDSHLIDESFLRSSEGLYSQIVSQESDSYSQQDVNVADLEGQLLSVIFDSTPGSTPSSDTNQDQDDRVSKSPSPDTYYRWLEQLSILQPVYLTASGKYRPKTLGREGEFTFFKKLRQIRSKIKNLIDQLPDQIIVDVSLTKKKSVLDIINSEKQLREIYLLIEKFNCNTEELCQIKDLWSQIDQLVTKYQDIRNHIVQHNLRLVFNCVSKHFFWIRDTMDLVQEGYIGLINAIDRFDIDKGYRLSTYAMWWIRQSSQRASENLNRIVYLPAHVTEKKSKYLKIINGLTDELYQTLGHKPSISEVVEALIKDCSLDIEASDLDFVVSFLNEEKEKKSRLTSNQTYQVSTDEDDLIRNQTNVEQLFRIGFPPCFRWNSSNIMNPIESDKHQECYEDIRTYLSKGEKDLLGFYLSRHDLKLTSINELEIWLWILRIREDISKLDTSPTVGEIISQIPLGFIIMEEIQKFHEFIFDIESPLKSEALFELLINLTDLFSQTDHPLLSTYSLYGSYLSDVKNCDLEQNIDLPSVEDELLINSDKESLDKILDTLTSRERLIIQLRFGLDEDTEHTLAEIGTSLGISRERVRQIEGEAISKLQSGKRKKLLQEINFGSNSHTGIGRRIRSNKRISIKPQPTIKNELRQFLPLLGRSISQYEWQRLLDSSVSEMDWSVRTSNVINELKYRHLSEVATRIPEEWLATKNFGKKSLNEIKNKILQFLDVN